MNLSDKLDSIGRYPHHGMLIHLPSLKTTNSAGIGEFYDILDLLDWFNSIGFDTIQLLPLNDTGYDPSPYNPISFFALNPIYISLQQLPLVNEHPLLQEQLMIFQDLNDLAFVNYPLLYQLKERFLYFYAKIYKDQFHSHPPFKTFLKENPWLQEYAAFKILHDASAPIADIKSAHISPIDSTAIIDQYSEKFLDICLVQFFAYEQLAMIKKQASERDLLVMGDLPFLISSQSTEAHFHPSWFNFNVSVGAPPDSYNTEGQDWGFPAYEWDDKSFKKTNPLIAKLKHMESFYHLFRIDHVVGLYRQWLIERGLAASQGYYHPNNDELALEQGHKLLQSMMKSTSMVPIAEDLGVVPPFIRQSLESLQSICTNVMRWEKEYDKDGSFITPNQYPHNSVCCISTHDSSLIDQWWTDYPNEAKSLCQTLKLHYTPKFTPQLRLGILSAAHQSTSLFHINPIQEYLSLNPQWQPQEPVTGRINTPGTTLAQNWTTRIKPYINDIIKDTHLTQLIESLT